MTKEAKIILMFTFVVLGGIFWLAIRGSKPTSVDTALLVRDHSFMTGKRDAKVTVVEFADYQCPACAMTAPIVKQVMAAYKDNPEVNFVFRNFPLPQHTNAQPAAHLAEYARTQGKFLDMNFKFYETQTQWSTAANPVTFFKTYAEQLGLDPVAAEKAVKDKQFSSIINADLTDAGALRVSSTPTFFINGIKFARGLSFEEFKREIDTRLAQ